MQAPVPDQIFIGRSVLDAIARHARDEAPNECCGLLIGTLPHVELSVRTRNLESSPTRYLIDPRDHFAAIRTARAMSHGVVGAYHSHPAALPEPSARDLREAFDAAFLYVIVSLATDAAERDIRAWRLVRGRFDEVRLFDYPPSA